MRVAWVRAARAHGHAMRGFTAGGTGFKPPCPGLQLLSAAGGLSAAAAAVVLPRIWRDPEPWAPPPPHPRFVGLQEMCSCSVDRCIQEGILLYRPDGSPDEASVLLPSMLPAPRPACPSRCSCAAGRGPGLRLPARVLACQGLRPAQRLAPAGAHFPVRSAWAPAVCSLCRVPDPALAMAHAQPLSPLPCPASRARWRCCAC